MTVDTIAELPDGRKFLLTLEPKFDRTGHTVTNFVLHALEDVTGRAEQLLIGGDVGKADLALRLVDGP